MRKGDAHSFPEIVRNYAKYGKVETIIGRDQVAREILIIPGTYKGKNGIFEFIKEPYGLINHRFFNTKRN